MHPRWKVAYLVAVTILTFAAPAKVRPLVVAVLLALQVAILLAGRVSPGEVFRMATRLKVVFLFLVGCYLLLPGERHDRVIRWPVGPLRLVVPAQSLGPQDGPHDVRSDDDRDACLGGPAAWR